MIWKPATHLFSNLRPPPSTPFVHIYLGTLAVSSRPLIESYLPCRPSLSSTSTLFAPVWGASSHSSASSRRNHAPLARRNADHIHRYLLKERYYLSEALISTIAGVILSPHATNFVRPLQYANGNEIDLETITLYFTRLVLGVQLVLAGVQLPNKYLWKQWRSLSLLLGPGLFLMWIVSSLLVWAMVPNINFLFALAVGACVTPTDPVLSNSIVSSDTLRAHGADSNGMPVGQR